MAEKTTTVSPWQILKFFWGYYMQKKRLFWPLFVLRILIPIVSLLPATYYKELIDLISNFTGQDKNSLIPALMSIVLIIAGIKFLQVVLYRLSEFFLIKMSTEIMQKIYQDSFSYLQGHSYQFFVNNFTGSLIRKV